MFNILIGGLSAHSWFNDLRLSLRFGVIVDQIGNNFGSTLPKSGGNHGQAQAIYRFMNNVKVTAQLLYHSAGSFCKELLSETEGQTYLTVSDTTKLDYSTNKSADNLDCLDYPHQKGLFFKYVSQNYGLSVQEFICYSFVVV